MRLGFLVVLACSCVLVNSQQQLAAAVPVVSAANVAEPIVCPFYLVFENGNTYYYYSIRCDGSHPVSMQFAMTVETGCNATNDKCNYELEGESSLQSRNQFQFVTLMMQQKKEAKTIVKYIKKSKQTAYLDKDADIVPPDGMKDKVKKISSRLVEVKGAKKAENQYFRIYEVKFTVPDTGEEFFFITGQEVDPKQVKPKDVDAIGTFKTAAKDILVVGVREFHVTLKEE